MKPETQAGRRTTKHAEPPPEASAMPIPPYEHTFHLDTVRSVWYNGGMGMAMTIQPIGRRYRMRHIGGYHGTE
jgi:hypothetical protein